MRRLRTAGLLALGLVALPALVRADVDVPDCVTVRADARWNAYGYDHWLRVENGCERAVRCELSTDVNPEVHRVEIAPGEHVERLTYRGSPAREFEPRVRCTPVD
ncbi:MAG TPA: hypothetical protein RMH99_14710 [Sandaracinaceae bacterium LLY-WYZ-13_1]|nr:hypothetical protein [Sandaracinaceae bacterium LLY-WYZ-13_1]